MTIDSLYNNIDKNNFYIGRISQVYRDNSVAQVENLSLLAHRKMVDEFLIPNTINYLVVIESVKGVFLGEVFKQKFRRLKIFTIPLTMEKRKRYFQKLILT